MLARQAKRQINIFRDVHTHKLYIFDFHIVNVYRVNIRKQIRALVSLPLQQNCAQSQSRRKFPVLVIVHLYYVRVEQPSNWEKINCTAGFITYCLVACAGKWKVSA